MMFLNLRFVIMLGLLSHLSIITNGGDGVSALQMWPNMPNMNAAASYFTPSGARRRPPNAVYATNQEIANFQRETAIAERANPINFMNDNLRMMAMHNALQQQGRSHPNYRQAAFDHNNQSENRQAQHALVGQNQEDIDLNRLVAQNFENIYQIGQRNPVQANQRIRIAGSAGSPNPVAQACRAQAHLANVHPTNQSNWAGSNMFRAMMRIFTCANGPGNQNNGHGHYINNRGGNLLQAPRHIPRALAISQPRPLIYMTAGGTVKPVSMPGNIAIGGQNQQQNENNQGANGINHRIAGIQSANNNDVVQQHQPGNNNIVQHQPGNNNVAPGQPQQRVRQPGVPNIIRVQVRKPVQPQIQSPNMAIMPVRQGNIYNGPGTNNNNGVVQAIQQHSPVSPVLNLQQQQPIMPLLNPQRNPSPGHQACQQIGRPAAMSPQQPHPCYRLLTPQLPGPNNYTPVAGPVPPNTPNFARTPEGTRSLPGVINGNNLLQRDATNGAPGLVRDD